MSAPDLKDLRYLYEVGWFLYHERYVCEEGGISYDEERVNNSRLILEDVLNCIQKDEQWLQDRLVVSIGSGCTGELAAWPAAVKVSADPLLNVYQRLGMLIDDVPGTGKTTYLACGVEDLPLVDACADLVVCRNALDHMLEPAIGVEQMGRLVKDDGLVFFSVDIGGEPGPDEPTVFSVESLTALLEERFELVGEPQRRPPHSQGRECSMVIVGRRRGPAGPVIDKEAVLQDYVEQLRLDGRPVV